MKALRILQHARVPNCQVEVSRRFEGYAAIQVVLTGSIAIETDGERRLVAAPYIWCTYPGPEFRYYSTGSEPWGHRYLSMRGDQADQWLDAGLLFKDGYACDVDTLQWIERELDAIIEEHEKIERYAEALSHNLLERFLLKLARRRSTTRQSESLRGHLLSYLQQENYRPNGYSALATKLNVGESTLRRRFREEVGIPIHQFTERERVRQCKLLLRTTEHSLEEIASMMQYPDVYYFSRHFTKLTGLRPGAYRRAEF